MSIPDISFIILTWNSEGYLRRCFDSVILKCSGEALTAEIIVIDNGSSDDSCAIVEEYQSNYPEMFNLRCLGMNMGTTFTRNMGLKQARGNHICILDSDTEMGEGHLRVILDRLNSDPSIGIIAPRLLLPDGSVQHSIKRFPTMFVKFLKGLRLLAGKKPKNYDFYEEFPFMQECVADTAISACWLFRKDLLERVGYLDEEIFYSPEDLDFSIRVWKEGYSILYYPDFTVLHHTQQISHKKPLSRTALSHLKGLLYYYWKHGGWLVRPRI